MKVVLLLSALILAVYASPLSEDIDALMKNGIEQMMEQQHAHRRLDVSNEEVQRTVSIGALIREGAKKVVNIKRLPWDTPVPDLTNGQVSPRFIKEIFNEIKNSGVGQILKTTAKFQCANRTCEFTASMGSGYEARAQITVDPENFKADAVFTWKGAVKAKRTFTAKDDYPLCAKVLGTIRVCLHPYDFDMTKAFHVCLQVELSDKKKIYASIGLNCLRVNSKGKIKIISPREGIDFGNYHYNLPVPQ